MARSLLPCLLAAVLAVPAAAAPSVVTSISPVHALVAAVMADTGASPHLVVRGAGSAHAYRLKPSDARALARADLVFWIGAHLETFLARAVATIPERAVVVSLAEAPGIAPLANRDPGRLLDDGHAAHRHGHGRDADPHLWLDPANAQAMAAAIAAHLTAADPANADLYRRNAAALTARLDDLDHTLAARLAPLRGVPYVVFHDAFQYLEQRYGLSPIGAVTLNPERPPGAKRVARLRAAMRAQGVRCLFREPQFESALVATLVEGLAVATAELDPLGAAHPPGPDAYFRMMQANADAMSACLGGG